MKCDCADCAFKSMEDCEHRKLMEENAALKAKVERMTFENTVERGLRMTAEARVARRDAEVVALKAKFSAIRKVCRDSPMPVTSCAESLRIADSALRGEEEAK